MKLRDLLSALPVYEVIGNQDIEISSIAADSRKVTKGSLFIAVVGLTINGHQFVQQAMDRGASAVVIERGQEVVAMNPSVTRIIVRDSRRALAILSDAFYHHPSQHLKVIGVTGTNGKTTTTHLIRSILQDHGYKTGLIGTISSIIGHTVIPSKNTTPESIDLHQLLMQMVEENCQYAIMEVSSHALVQGRVRGVRFATSIFTNLSQDHLDYHRNMEDYRQAKGLLFAQMGNSYEIKHRPVILNADDPASEAFKKMTAAPILTYGIEKDADIRATNVHVTDQGLRYLLQTWAGEAVVELKITGKFNVYNSLAAIAATLHEGLPLQDIIESLAQVTGVDGRMQKVDAGQDFTVFVDYAHTPDGLENVLTTIKQFAKGKIITIVGCGGDRDRSKRPLMARIAAKMSDIALFTSDNPRTENPMLIIEDMIAGLKSDGETYSNYEVIVDRKEAIERGIALAQANDILLIAGKGHETYQDFGTHIIHFDDRQIALEALRRKINAQNGS